jgi:hypothetical protein
VRYENLLTRSFAILRRRLWLWPLALLAGETSSGGGFGGGGGGNVQLQGSTPAPDLSSVSRWLSDNTALFAQIAVVALIVALAWFLVSCVASGALLGAAARMDAGEPISFGAAWRMGTGAFRRVLALKLLLVLAILVPALLLAVPLLLGSLGGDRGLLVGLVLDVPLLIAYVYWAAFVNWFAQLALRACVLDELGAMSAIAAARALLMRRFPRIALTTVVFIGAGLGISILTSAVFAFLEAPLLGSLLTEIGNGHWSALPATLLLWVPILAVVSLAVSSAVGAYFAIAWTLAYRRFDVAGALPEPLPLPA